MRKGINTNMIKQKHYKPGAAVWVNYWNNFKNARCEWAPAIIRSALPEGALIDNAPPAPGDQWYLISIEGPINPLLQLDPSYDLGLAELEQNLYPRDNHEDLLGSTEPNQISKWDNVCWVPKDLIKQK